MNADGGAEPAGADAGEAGVVMDQSGPATLEDLLALVARGDELAFEAVYDRVSAQVYGLIRRVLRDPSQSEEVAQEVLVDVWRQAPRYDRGRGTPMGWILTMAHRRAVDRVRSASASTAREQRVASIVDGPAYDEVAETVERHFEQERVRRALDGLTDLQREAVTLAYYGGHTQREVADLLGVPLGTVKTRLRDGMIRLRDALGVET